MVTLSMLWLPILVSAVFVFIAANVLWMALPFWHHKDYGKIADAASDAIAASLKDTPGGQYMVPNMNWGTMTPEQKEAVQKGPGGLLLLRNPMQFSMGSSLTAFFLYNVVVITFVAYVASLALGPGAKYPQVFRVVGSAGILGYAFHTVSDSIWYGKPWSATIKFFIDGIIYGLLIAGTFGWLWPR
jgi:Flp pilus assembly protein TadB